MINVDLSSFELELDNINKYIGECEQNVINLFNNLKNSCLDWQDSFSNQFEKMICLDKNEDDLFFSFLVTIKKIFECIYREYKLIGDSLIINLGNKTKIITDIDKCCNKITEITSNINDLESLDLKFDFENVKNQIFKIRDILFEYNNKVNNLYNKIEKNENMIKIMLLEFDDIFISDFIDLFKLKIINKNGYINKDDLLNDIIKIQYYSECEYDLLKKIVSSYIYIYQNYKTRNSQLIYEKIAYFNKMIESIFSKRKKYILFLNNVINNYDLSLAKFNMILNDKKNKGDK